MGYANAVGMTDIEDNHRSFKWPLNLSFQKDFHSPQISQYPCDRPDNRPSLRNLNSIFSVYWCNVTLR